MALSDVLKRYGETGATEGIMVPSANVQSITTEQEVYDSATDGIMTINNEQYIGPNATVTYGGEDTAYNRMLREIEQGELPQFDQSTFPAVGTGIMESSTPVTQPVDTTPVTKEQEFDPCPPGYKLINGVCQLVNPQQDVGRGGDRPTFTGPKISASGVIEGYTGVLGRDRPTAGRYDAISEEYGKAVADKVFEVNRTYRNRGAQLKAITEEEKNRILNVYGQERLNKDYVEGNNGVFYRVVATSPTMSELATDAAIATGQIIDATTEQGVGFGKAASDILKQLEDLLVDDKDKVVEPPKSEEGSTIVTRTGEGPIQEETTTDRPEPTQVPTLTMEDFGGIDNISNLVNTYSNDFGEINKFLIEAKDLQERLDKMEARPPQLKNRNSEKLARNNLKKLIAKNEKDRNDKIKEAKDNEEKLQNEINNSKESKVTVGDSSYTVHTNDKGKILGYSTLGSNTVQVAGFPPVGPGLRIKTKSRASELRENFKNIRSGS